MTMNITSKQMEITPASASMSQTVSPNWISGKLI
ncbi:Uncharacterised protein [Klebsiella pneumoniae]|nr:Uncharacterised protein [Klebsiella pneumoniae]